MKKLLLFFALLSMGATADPRHITVTGKAELRVPPDGATITLGVHSFAADLTQARTDNDSRLQRIIAAIRKLGLPADAIRTSAVSIEPETKDDQKIVGFTANNTLEICPKDLHLVQPILTAAFANGANRLEGVTFTTTQERKYRDQARRDAIKAAQEKAADMAAQLGQHLGPAVDVTEGGTDLMTYSYNTQSAKGHFDLAQGSIVAGSISVDAEVHITFEMSP